MKRKHTIFQWANTLSRAAFVMMLSVLFVGQAWGEVVSFSGSNLDIISETKTVSVVTLSNVSMTSYSSSGLNASGAGKTFTITASGGVISKVEITLSSSGDRYTQSTVTNCTSCSRSGKVITCAINNATSVSCTTVGGGATVTQIDVTIAPSWKLTGDFNSWGETAMEPTTGGVSVKVNLAAHQRYQFKFKKESTFYGNTGAIVSNISGWAFSGSLDNCTLYTGPEGEYTFELNTTSMEAAVTYPTVSHPNPNYVYFIPGTTSWSSPRIYNWEDGTDNRMSDWDGAPTITTQTNICGQDYYYCACYFNRVQFRDNGSNQTKVLVPVLGQYKDERNHDADFAPFATHTLSFAAGGGEGSMSAISGICNGADEAIPANEFTKSGFLFDHWTANQDVTVGGSVIASGDAIPAGATIENIGTDITLTAQWHLMPSMFQYILGSCQVKNGVWTQGGDGSVSAWRYKTEDGNLLATTDIGFSASTAGVYFNSKDLTKLDDPSKWGTSQGGNRAIKALKVGGGSTLEFDLNGLTAYKIVFYVFPSASESYSIELTVNGSKTSHNFSGEKDVLHKYEYASGSYTGTFSIKSNNKESRVVVIVEVPAVKITFDANGGSGSMASMLVSEGDEVQLPANEFTLAGSRFLGWTEDAGGTGSLIADEDMYATSADVTLYAQWAILSHTTITLDATGAYNRYTSSVEATMYDQMPELNVLPNRVGYVFDGYYEAPSGAGQKYYTGLGAGVIPWDKTDPSATLYANWIAPCDLTPVLVRTTPVVTIWDKNTVDLGVAKLICDFDTTGVTYELQSVSPADPIEGCHFEFFDEQIHLIGMPNRGNSTTETINVILTMTNNCSGSTPFDITITIRIYPESQKPKVAFIITGTEKSSIAAGGDFSAYSAEDKAACNDLLTYLGNFYDVTCVNGYATKDEAEIAAYYEQYDLLVVTDFLNTGKGYTNKLGTLIDKKPILSFEAYVASQSNWHIGSNPRDPSPKVKSMKILCAGHAIFKDAKYLPSSPEETQVVNPADTTVQVLSTLSTEKNAKGLQGFVINEAPDFIFLATVRDEANDRDLVVCCERQMVFSARLLIYGINFYEMGGLSEAGQIVMHQMMDYLLMTDETKIADCSLVFDNHHGTGVWSDPQNWAPGYNIVPTPYHPTRIAAVCNVDIDNAHAGSVKINQGRSGAPEGKLIIKPYGGLTVAGIVLKVHDTRYASPVVIKAEDLLIESDATGNGAFVYGNKESDVRATVEYYSRGEGAAVSSSPAWQYMGIPFQGGKTAISMYHEAWMCRWTESTTDGLGGLWQWVENDDVLAPFEGYCITQKATKTYTNSGKLNAPVTRVIQLDNCDATGYAFAANSWTAPIKIQEMQDADFVNAERAIYIYHSGSYAQWEANGDPVSAVAPGAAATLPGQYAVVPIHSSPYITGADSVIPAMQGFFVKATNPSNAQLKLVYNRVVYDATYFKTSTQPMRSPRRAMSGGNRPEVMVLTVAGDSIGADRVHLLMNSEFSEHYEDGWDGRKIAGDAAVPMLSVLKGDDSLSVAALPTAEERYLLFRAGEDSVYTFHFDYAGETIYLYDLVTEQAVEIQTEGTYTFTATNKEAAPRFLITKNPPEKVPTDIQSPAGSLDRQEGARKILYQNGLYILHHGRAYDAQGARVSMGKEVTR